MNATIDTRSILKNLLEYPEREFPEETAVDSRKKPTTPKNKKKKNEQRIDIPAWAADLPDMRTEIDKIDDLIKRQNELDIPDELVKQATEQIKRMKKEIR